MIDLHCHLDLYPDPLSVVAECEARALYILSVTTAPSAWEGTRVLAANAKRVRTALGLHPQLAGERLGELPLFESLLPGARYVGEIGLDGSSDQKSFTNQQREAFSRILVLCAKHGGRMMSIHSRRAVSDVLTALASHSDAGIPVLHWFAGTQNELARAIDLGCWFSVGPTMLGTSKGTALAKEMPKERTLTETDGPFAQLDGRSAVPWDCELAVGRLAAIWGVDVVRVREQLRENLRNLVSLTT